MILDLHVHSNCSDGLNSPELMAKAAKKSGLDGFALTDHSTIKGLKPAGERAKKLGLNFIPGIEINCPDGHVTGLFIKQNIEKAPIKEVAEKIKDLGGVSIAVHPYDILRHGCHDLVKSLKFDYVETFNARTVIPMLNTKAEKIANEFNLKKVAGSDAHWYKEVGLGCVSVDDLDDLYKGKVEISRKKWAGIGLITIETLKRRIRDLKNEGLKGLF